ncbi:flagellar hook protein FliD [Chania multitudinisentens RB-25]|uniref:Flagellar hook-associated protein 2 n=1 Tax=Chania multitudinisentens RB-25 TaxID=1441930 RepID=W0LJ98_9GAMM|nr:flagellar filament capping protein FliD [Chania multitudinisentens]AHG22070.1 flagellar hook protein FliD [Chania multitudinisentens RB-25]
MASISSLGIGSGLDLNGLLEQMSKAEQQRLMPYTTQQTSSNAKLTAYGTLKGALEKFDNLSKELANADFFNNTTASQHSQFNITTNTRSVAGSYSIDVRQLAQSPILTSTATIAAQTAKLGSDGAINRSISITAGVPPKEVKISLHDEQTSLVEMRDAINRANAGVNATIMRVGDNAYALALNSSTSGENSQIAIQVNNDDKLGELFNYDPAKGAANPMFASSKGQDAKIQINGIEITRSTNSITDALQGVTINLISTTKPSEPQNLIINTDKQGSADKIKQWVDSYNSLLDISNSLTKYTPVKSGESQNSKNGALLGDYTLRGLQSSIKSILSTAQDNPELKGLGNLGISTNSKTGKLEINNEKLKKAIDEKPQQITNFFVGNGKNTGMATEIHNEIQEYIKAEGILEKTTKSIDKDLERLTTQIARVSESIQNTIDRYKQQFVQLDNMMSKLNGTSAYLTQQFSSKKP